MSKISETIRERAAKHRWPWPLVQIFGNNSHLMMEDQMLLYLEITAVMLEMEQTLIQLLALYIEKAIKKKKRKLRAYWTRRWISKRARYGMYENLMQELANEDLPAYKNFIRINRDMYNGLL